MTFVVLPGNAGMSRYNYDSFSSAFIRLWHHHKARFQSSQRNLTSNEQESQEFQYKGEIDFLAVVRITNSNGTNWYLLQIYFNKYAAAYI